MSQSIKSEQFINASQTLVYLALTRSLLLNQWLCDFATVNPRPGGRIYLWWNGDFYSAGEYIELIKNEKVKFTWHSRMDPSPSEVTITLTPKNQGTQLLLVHDVPGGDAWRVKAENFKKEWDSSLPNLSSLLETGLDRRVYDRPMLGIQVSDFNPEIAKATGVPVTEGIRIAEATKGMGANAAGLAKDDVIIELNDHPITNDFGSLAIALQGKKGGEIVNVVFYRGSKKQSVEMELTKRPVWDIPQDPKELSKQVYTKYEQGFKMLEEVFSGVSDGDASYCPAPGEWNAKQVLAHLIHTERYWLTNIDDLVGGYGRHSDDFSSVSTAHLDATITAFGGVEGMIKELKALADEVVAFLADLPAEFLTMKSNYINIGITMLQGMLPHTQSHVEQIRQAIRSARK